MLPAWVMGFADGSEHGAYLALDLGGTNLRVCVVVLEKEGRKFDMIQSKYRLVLRGPYFTNPISPRSSEQGPANNCLDMSLNVLQDF